MWFEEKMSFEVDEDEDEETTSTCRMKLLAVGATSFFSLDDEE